MSDDDRDRSLSPPPARRDDRRARSPDERRARSPVVEDRRPVSTRSPSPSRSPSRDRRDSRRRRSPSRSRSRDSRRRRSISPPRRRRSPSPRRGYSPARGGGAVGTTMFVAGFNFIVDERELEYKFGKYGRVKEVRIVRNPANGESRGFGFVVMEESRDAKDAIRDLNGRDWNGRRVLVEVAKNPR